MASWPERLLERQTAALISDQALNSVTGVNYALISRTSTPMRGPYVLECTNLRTGSVHRGPLFSVGGIAIASGYLWVYAAARPAAQPVIYQVNPATLARIRSIPLPPVPAEFGGAVFATGPSKSVWIGAYQTLLRVGVSTGTAMRRVRLPPGLAVSDIAVDPAGMAVYVSAARIARDGTGGLVMLEYDARSGQRLAAASSGLLRSGGASGA